MTPANVNESGLWARIDALEAALRKEPTPRAYAPLAEAYRLSGRLDDAVATARRGTDAHPDHVGIRVVLARALVDLNDGAMALGAYREVLERDPDNLEAQAYVAAAREAQARAVAVDRDAGTEAGSSGTAVERLDDVSPVKADDNVLGATGSLSEELAHLADLFVPSAGGSDGESPELGPSSIATLTLAEIYARQGLYEKAAEVCERILESDPANEEAISALEEYRGSLSAVESDRG